ncbi:MAG: C10 family peptidase, partial [Muribaculaceae bacterium]
ACSSDDEEELAIGGSHIKSAYQYLKDLGYNCEYNTGNISFGKVKDEILSRNPHLISGAGDGSTGHMWVIDGISVVNGLAKYHCNWGWNGICDCWSIADPFTPLHSSPYYRRFRHIYTNSNIPVDNEVGEPL